MPWTHNHARPFIALSALFLAPPTPSSSTKKRQGFKCGHYKHATRDLALRLEPCMARTQDVGQRGRTTIDVVLFHFLHYFHSSIPSTGTEKRQGLKCSRAKHASRTRGFALRLELSLAMSDLRAFQPPRTSYHAYLFIAHSALFPLLHPILPAQKSAGASNAGVPNMRIAACLAASSLHITNERSGVPVRWFIALSALSTFIPPTPPAHRKSAKASCPGAWLLR